MGLTWRPNPVSHSQAFEAMRAALSAGATYWNGGEFYGTPENNSLTLLRAYFTKYPEDADKVLLSVKGTLGRDLHPDGSREGVRRSVGNCIDMIGGTKKIDIFECARVDKRVPIEDTVKYLAELVAEGKIGGIALSEVSADTVRRAAKVHKIATVEVEVSLHCTEIWTNGVAEACKELDIPISAYSPLSRGFFTGQIKKREDIPEGDMRLHYPRFSKENFEGNMEIVRSVDELAKKKGCTSTQLALAWVKQMGDKEGQPVIVPIPGATTAERVRENFKIVTLEQGEMDEINKLLEGFEVKGTRYPEQSMHLTWN